MITEKELAHLRTLAEKQRTYAEHSIMKEREKLWFAHNSLQAARPLVVMEEETFWDEIRPPLFCTDALAREVEDRLLRKIVPYELFDDDKVVPPYYRVEKGISGLRYGVHREKEFASTGPGFHIVPIIETIEDDFEKLSMTQFHYDPQPAEEKRAQIDAWIGDILPVELVPSSNPWSCSLSQQVVELMGTENMFCAMLDEPEAFHRLMKFIADDTIAMLHFQQSVGCVHINNGNDYMGSGSYCFTTELPQKDFHGTPRICDTWGHLNSQESVGISIDMYREFVIPETKRVAHEFGLLYYGCCEPVSDFWEGGVEQIQNLRKVSVSAWCDEAYIAPRLQERGIIYSRKPSPNFIGIQNAFDETAFRAYIRNTANILKDTGCKAEFIFRDIYTLHGNIDKLKRVVDITREETEKCYSSIG